jgi:hypothetical protein
MTTKTQQATRHVHPSYHPSPPLDAILATPADSHLAATLPAACCCSSSLSTDAPLQPQQPPTSRGHTRLQRTPTLTKTTITGGGGGGAQRARHSSAHGCSTVDTVGGLTQHPHGCSTVDTAKVLAQHPHGCSTVETAKVLAQHPHGCSTVVALTLTGTGSRASRSQHRPHHQPPVPTK